MKKSKLLLLVIVVFLPLLLFGIFKTMDYVKEQKENKIKKEIKSHYNTYVITTKESKLYKKNSNGKYKESGKINKDVKIKLEKEKIYADTKYFLIDDLDLYISYKNVKKTEKFVKNDRYQNYIPFNANAKTKDKTIFYDENGKYLYIINEEIDTPVLVDGEEYYGVEYNDELLYVKASEVSSYNKINTFKKNKSRIRTLTYHFIYDERTEKCGQEICLPLSKFEEHMKYLSENEYFTMKLNELELYLDGRLQIPEKSIVLTIDDGTMFNLKALDILKKYKTNLTMFVITGMVKTNNLKSSYLDLESHSDNMHNQYECKGQGEQGGGILCLPEDKVLKDLKTSQDKLGGSKYFAYPFFDFNNRAIKLLKQAGFTMAFIGQYDTNGYSYPKVTDKFKVRRKTIFSNLTQREFIQYLY